VDDRVLDGTASRSCLIPLDCSLVSLLL
jgi:hypothetical protein